MLKIKTLSIIIIKYLQYGVFILNRTIHFAVFSTDMKQGATVLVNGYFGAGNAGDEAILGALISLLKEKNAKITIASSDPDFTEDIHGVNSIPEHHQNATRWREVARDCDHIIIGGGGLIESKNITNKWYDLALECQDLSCSLHFLGVGFTPPTSVLYEKLYVKTLKRAETISVRDQRSLAWLQSLGIDRPISVNPDFAFYHSDTDLPRKPDLTSNRLLLVIRDVPWLTVDIEGLVDIVQKVSNSTECNVQITEFAGKERDRLLIKDFKKKLRDLEITVVTDNDYRSLEKRIRDSRYVIGMRLHSIIFAAKHGVPYLSVAYNPKCESIPRMFGYANVNWCENINAEDAAKTIIDSWSDLRLREYLSRRARLHHNCVQKTFSGLESGTPVSDSKSHVLGKIYQRSMQVDDRIRKKLGIRRPSAPSWVVPTDSDKLASQSCIFKNT